MIDLDYESIHKLASQSPADIDRYVLDVTNSETAPSIKRFSQLKVADRFVNLCLPEYKIFVVVVEPKRRDDCWALEAELES